ncbi:MAG TPA: glycerophosphodiester phosphodiesterase family protein [Acetobacteraceae bacterium]|nr:glycerophosphodiester phosphodiesterase family protein [Acetobacteraceae bacterium]
MKQIGLFGHRGARGLAPENTLEGFELARSYGLTGVEFDICITADGVPVLHHDPYLNASITRDCKGAYIQAPTPLIHELTRAQLATYDVGRIRPGTDYGRQHAGQVAHDGARIPTLADALAHLDGLELLIELKTFPDAPEHTATPADMAEAVINVLRAAGAIKRSKILAFDWRALRAARGIEPGLRRCCLTAPDTLSHPELWLKGVDLGVHGGNLPRAVAWFGAACWAPWATTLEARDIYEAQTLGLEVLAWTVNDPVQIRRLIEARIDGIITDRPDLAAAAIEAAGYTIRPPRGR